MDKSFNSLDGILDSLWMEQVDRIAQEDLAIPGTPAQCAKGGYFFRMGESAPCFFYLQSGRVKIEVFNAWGEEKTLCVLEPGNFFGETAFFDGGRRFTSAIADVDSKAIRITKADFKKIYDSNKLLTLLILCSLGRKIRSLVRQVEDMTFLTQEKRLHKYLLSLLGQHMVETSEGPALGVELTEEQLGCHIGARREAVSRSMARLKELGLVKKDKRKLYFPDPDRFKDLALSPD